MWFLKFVGYSAISIFVGVKVEEYLGFAIWSFLIGRSIFRWAREEVTAIKYLAYLLSLLFFVFFIFGVIGVIAMWW